LTWMILLPILIAIMPVISILLWYSRLRLNYWLYVLFGGAGWFIALVARLPLLIYLRLVLDRSVLFLVLSAVFAGVFEESTRLVMLDYFLREKINHKPVVFGLGWGFMEALIIYVIPVSLIAIQHGYSWMDYLPGAFERNTAIIIHFSLTLLAAYAVVTSRGFAKYFFILITASIHALYNNIALYLLLLRYNAWFLESILFITTIPLLITSIAIYYRVFKEYWQRI
jgi:uncharacterized membrane protein YhfC